MKNLHLFFISCVALQSLFATSIYSMDIFEAISAHDIIRIEECIYAKPDIVNCRNYIGQTPLHHAIHSGTPAIVILLILMKANVNLQDNKRHTPLHIAAWNDKDEVIRLLIQANANANLKDDLGNTPLHYAVCSLKATAALLTAPNIDVDPQDGLGATPLHRAVQNKNFEAAKALIRLRAKTTVKDCYGFTPLHYAEHPEIVSQWN